MQADSHSKLTISREQKRKDGIILLICNNRVIFFIHSRVYSWVLGAVNIFQPHLPLRPLCPIKTHLWAGLPVLQTASGKVRYHLASRECFRWCHILHTVSTRILHNSSGKCQYTQSMMIRRFRQYSRLSHCYLDCKCWIVLFLLWHDRI